MIKNKRDSKWRMENEVNPLLMIIGTIVYNDKVIILSIFNSHHLISTISSILISLIQWVGRHVFSINKNWLMVTNSIRSSIKLIKFDRTKTWNSLLLIDVHEFKCTKGRVLCDGILQYTNIPWYVDVQCWIGIKVQI